MEATPALDVTLLLNIQRKRGELDLNKKIYGAIECWRHRPIEGEHPTSIWTASKEAADAEDRLVRLYRLVEDGLTDLDDVLKARLVALKAGRGMPPWNAPRSIQPLRFRSILPWLSASPADA
jgi:hypothetical protein